jgi:L-fucose mutarotase/ribose pyranase (RbsD/FucU family)
MKMDWEEILKDRLQFYGHRNWLVIADSAYPAQSKQGIETIVADEEQTTVLERTLAILVGCKHVTPRIYTDKELRFVREEDAPGISSYREKLLSLLEGHELTVLPHEEIIAKLDRVGQTFRTLLIKTSTRIPYTSVFFELECGYWTAQAEKRLRAAIVSRNGSSGGGHSRRKSLARVRNRSETRTRRFPR